MTSLSTPPVPRHITSRPSACPTLPSASRIGIGVHLGVEVALGAGVPVMWADAAKVVGAGGYCLQVLHPGAPRVTTQVINLESSGNSEGIVVGESVHQVRTAPIPGLAVSTHETACPYETITFDDETIGDPAREHGASLAGDGS